MRTRSRGERSQLTAFIAVPFLIMGRVTYLHHYLPTLWFAVIMAGFCLDHFVFTARRFSARAKATVFGVIACLLIGTGFWMRACAWGIEGDIADYKGRVFRRVRLRSRNGASTVEAHCRPCRAGTSSRRTRSVEAGGRLFAGPSKMASVSPTVVLRIASQSVMERNSIV